MTIGDGFWACAEAAPEHVVLIDVDGSSVTARELLDGSRRVAAAFADLGLRRGDGVAAVMTNERGFFEVYLAAMESGLYFTPVNVHLAPAEMAHIVADSEAVAVVSSPSLAASTGSALDRIEYPRRHRLCLADVPGYVAVNSDKPSTARHSRSPGTVMLYTSGTTGRPKGVRRPLPTGNPDAVAHATAALTASGFGVTPGPSGVHLVCGPLYHAGPLVGASTSVHIGNTVVLMDKWTPELCLHLIERHRVTSTQMVPTMFHRLLSLEPAVRGAYDVSSLESVLHTGAPCPVDVKQRMMDWLGPVLYETYGGTETAATIATPRRWLSRPGTVGKPIRGVRLHILDDDGNEVANGTPGTIYIESERGRQATYFKDENKTREMKRGSLVTLGDVGFVDNEGHLFLCDRKIDMIISGGVNIYPAEVEAALLSHPAVADAAVIGTPDPEWGEKVTGILQLATGFTGSDEFAESIQRHVCERIARFKCPRRIEFTEDLGRAPNGKVDKKRLRSAYAGATAAVDRATASESAQGARS